MFPRAAIIILNWNGWEDTIECLESLQHLDYPDFQFILVDNASTDNSIKMIKDWCKGKVVVNSKYFSFTPEFKPLSYIEYDRLTADNGGKADLELEIRNLPSNRRIVIIEMDDNLGFTGGNNVAMRYALKSDYEYIWLLNNDTVADKSALTEMINVAEGDKKIGMVGSKILNYFSVEPIKRDHNLWATSLLIKKKCIENIGFLDENYFFGGEDADWCQRARLNDWKLSYCNRSQVWHKEAASTGYKFEEKLFFGRRSFRRKWEGFRNVGYYILRNRIYYERKFLSWFSFWLRLPIFIFRQILSVILYDDFKLKRIKILFIALKDALKGQMGKRKSLQIR